MKRKIRSAGQILRGTNHILHSVYAQSRELLDIEAVVHRFVEQDVAVASFKNNELTLITPSGALATRIRYRQRNIIASLHRAGIHVERLQIKVQPVHTPYESKPVERHLSTDTAGQLKQTAKYIEHEPLRKALSRLASRADQD